MPTTTCFKCQKKNDMWESRSLKDPYFLNGQQMFTKFFCPITERKIKDKSLPENQEKVLIIDCMNGDREEIREKTPPLSNS